MHPIDSSNPPPSPWQPDTPTAVAGFVLIVLGVLCGGGWTLVVGLGGFSLAGTFGLVATIAWIAAGVTLFVKGARPPDQWIGAGKSWGIAFCLIVLAVCLYWFAFVSCFKAVNNRHSRIHAGTHGNRLQFPAPTAAAACVALGSANARTERVSRHRRRGLGGVRLHPLSQLFAI